MKNTFLRPVIDQYATGENIKNIRKRCGLSVKDLQEVFGFEFPQHVPSTLSAELPFTWIDERQQQLSSL